MQSDLLYPKCTNLSVNLTQKTSSQKHSELIFDQLLSTVAQPSWFIELTIPGLKSWGKWRKGKGNFTGSCEHFFYSTYIQITCNAVYLGSIPGWGRSPGEGNGNPLQYSCLENSMDRGAWQAVHGITESWTRLSTHAHTGIYMKPLCTMIFYCYFLILGSVYWLFIWGRYKLRSLLTSTWQVLAPDTHACFPSCLLIIIMSYYWLSQ